MPFFNQHKNIKIHYTDEGSGSPIVLLHGFLENSAMWNDLKPELLKNNRVICIDLLGHGKTECIGYVHTMEDMANAVDAVLNFLNIESMVLIGHSMGGYVALAYAEKKPNTLKGLCLMNSTYEADDDERQKLRARANKMVHHNFDNLVRMSFANLFSTRSKVLHKQKFEKALLEALKTPIQGYIACQEGMRLRDNKFSFFKDLECKKLIIIGKKDTIVNSDILINDTKNTTIETVLLEEGHMSYIENKEELSYVIMHFIENL